ncbi:Modification methylase AplI [compost metagenome]
MHPEAHRPLTHREAARLQTFNDEFIFTGSKIEIAKQIGNAVPPLLAQAIARNLVRQLDQISSEELRRDRNRMTSEMFDDLLQEVVEEIFSLPSVQTTEEELEIIEPLQSIAR